MVESRHGHGCNVQTNSCGNELKSLTIAGKFGQDSWVFGSPCAGGFSPSGVIVGAVKQKFFGEVFKTHLVKHREHVVAGHDQHGYFFVQSDAVVLVCVSAVRFVVGAHNRHVCKRFCTLGGGKICGESLNSQTLPHRNFSQGRAVAVALMPAGEPFSGHNSRHIGNAQLRAFKHLDG